MQWTVLLSIVLLVGLCRAEVRDTAKTARAMCILDEVNSILVVHFRVHLDTDPRGNLTAIDRTAFNLSPKVFTSLDDCVTEYDGVNNVYSVMTNIDMDPADPDNNSNICGMVTGTNTNSETTYSFLFMHNIQENGFDHILDDKDRVYDVTCTREIATSNILSSAVSVSAPNLEATITPSQIDVQMSVEELVSGVWTPVTGTLVSGTTIRLKIEYERGADYIDNRDVAGVFPFELEAGSTINFDENDYLTNDNGCATRDTDATFPATLPFTLQHGFRASVVGTKYVLTTGQIMLWKYQTTSLVHFTAFFGICFAADMSKCNNLCEAETGSTALRRKRSATSDLDYGTATTYIIIGPNNRQYDDDRDQDNATKESLFSDTTVAVLSAVLGVLVLLTIITIIAALVCLRRRRGEQTHSRFDNMSNSSYPSYK